MTTTNVTRRTDRPDTVAGMLLEVVAFLDVADEALDRMSHLLAATIPTWTVEPYVPGDSMQTDIRALAAYFAEHPGLDYGIHGEIFGEPA